MDEKTLAHQEQSDITQLTTTVKLLEAVCEAFPLDEEVAEVLKTRKTEQKTSSKTSSQNWKRLAVAVKN